jgi:hypothetical protein
VLRKTGLQQCIRCGGRPVLGLSCTYYLFGSSKWKRQQKGSFPSRGFCKVCFLRIAKSRLEQSELDSLRRKVEYALAMAKEG